MVKARTWFSLFIMSVLTVGATASCGSDEATGGNGGASGGSIIGAGGGIGRSGSGGGSNTNSSKLGSTCTSDASCGAGLVCLKANSTELGSGGPANGLCTLPCESTDECDAVEAGSACFNFGTQAAPSLYCLEACTQGPPGVEPKCKDRPDFACTDLAAATAPAADPFCLPLCRYDEECGAGLFCSQRTGLCSKTKPTGDPFGTPCDPSATTDPCEGFCVQTSATGETPVRGQCAEVCAGNFPCNYTGTQPGGLCVVPSSLGDLDLAICRPNCECQSDCLGDDFCRAWSTTNADELAIKEVLGNADGLCFPNVTGSVAIECEGTGGAGGATGAAGAAGEPAVPAEGGAAGAN